MVAAVTGALCGGAAFRAWLEEPFAVYTETPEPPPAEAEPEDEPATEGT